MKISDILFKIKLENDEIYSSKINNKIHKGEISFRKKISNKKNINYFKELKKHHSIEVMDKEIKRIFICNIYGVSISICTSFCY